MTAGQDIEDVWGNPLDPALPIRSRTTRLSRSTANAAAGRVLSAEVDAHRGPGAHWTFYITIDFGEPVYGTFSTRSVEVQRRLQATAAGGGVTPRTGRQLLPAFHRRRPARAPSPSGSGTAPGSKDLAGNPNLAAEPLVIPYNARGRAERMPTPPDQHLHGGDSDRRPGAAGRCIRPVHRRNAYALTGQGGGALPSWLEFDPATRRMSGTPPAPAPAVTLDYTVNVRRPQPVRRRDLPHRELHRHGRPGAAACPRRRTAPSRPACPLRRITLAAGGGRHGRRSRYALDGLPAGLDLRPRTGAGCPARRRRRAPPP